LDVAPSGLQLRASAAKGASKVGQSRIFEDVTEAHTPVSEVSPTGVLCVFANMAKDLGCSTS